MLGTVSDLLDGAWEPPGTEAERFAEQAMPVLGQLANRLQERQEAELLLGFPSAPFVLPLATDSVSAFLNFVTAQPGLPGHPDHKVGLYRTGEGHAAEWVIVPEPQADLAQISQEQSYRLTFNLPENLETWIGQHEEHIASRTRAVKKQFLSDIVIYRMVGNDLQTFQLKYQPADFQRRRRG